MISVTLYPSLSYAVTNQLLRTPFSSQDKSFKNRLETLYIYETISRDVTNEEQIKSFAKDDPTLQQIALVFIGVKPSYFGLSPDDRALMEQVEILKEATPGIEMVLRDNGEPIIYHRELVEAIIANDKEFYSKFGNTIEEVLLNTFKKGQQGELLGYGSQRIIKDTTCAIEIFNNKGQSVLYFLVKPEEAERLGNMYVNALERLTGEKGKFMINYIDEIFNIHHGSEEFEKAIQEVRKSEYLQSRLKDIARVLKGKIELKEGDLSGAFGKTSFDLACEEEIYDIVDYITNVRMVLNNKDGYFSTLSHEIIKLSVITNLITLGCFTENHLEGLNSLEYYDWITYREQFKNLPNLSSEELARISLNYIFIGRKLLEMSFNVNLILNPASELGEFTSSISYFESVLKLKEEEWKIFLQKVDCKDRDRFKFSELQKKDIEFLIYLGECFTFPLPYSPNYNSATLQSI
jgi:hypothetical protein